MMKNISFFMAVILIILIGCKKADFNDDTATGEGLVDFTLIKPASGTTLQLNAALPNTVIPFSWNAAKPGLTTAPKYKVVAVLRDAVDFTSPLLSFESGNGGVANSLDLTYKQLDDALAAKGIAAGVTTNLKWSVIADNGSKLILAQSVYFLAVRRFKDGASPFYLLGPASSMSTMTLNPGSTTQNIVFNWTRSKPASGGPAVTYKVLFAERKLDDDGNVIPVNWSTPLFSINADNAGTDSLLTVSYKNFSDLLSANGFTSLPAPANLLWTVSATSGDWTQVSDYQNELSIIREVKVYMVGDATPGGWVIENSLRFAEDPRFPGTYFIYVYLEGGKQMKFVNGQAWPPAEGAVDWGQAPGQPAGTLTEDGEDNINITTSGVYRVTVDLTNKKFYIQTAVSNGIGGMGMIGAFQGWSQPATKMQYIAPGQFIYITNMNLNDEFKFHDGNDWDNGANNKNRWFAVDNANGSKMVIDPGSGYDNFKWTLPTGRARAIWDGSNPLNLTYMLNSAAEMRVVGNGINQAGVNDWDPGSSPQMTYSGNGVWTISLALKANMEIKFLAGNAWGAFDYEDNSGQSNATGTAKPIVWNGDKNFKTPATAGTYTITLNEYTQTVTIN